MHYVVTGVQMAELDRQTIDDYGVPGRALMEVAGRAVADAAMEDLPPHSAVVVACGGGNNGGDGFVTARAMAACHHKVRVFLFAERERYKGDAAAALQTLEKTQEASISHVSDARGMVAFAQALGQSRVVIDALLGIGVHDEVRGIIGDAIALINDHSTHVVSVDLPSGIDADTGAMLGRAVRARRTVTFSFAKRGHFLYPGAELCGALNVVDIGIPRALAGPHGAGLGRVLECTDGPRLLRRRDGESHKGTFGHVVVVAGSPSTPGAAILALRAALRSGAGLVSWGADDATVSRAPPRPPEVMLRRCDPNDPDSTTTALLNQATALVIGPGLGQTPESGRLLACLLERAQVPVCLDADALNLIAAQPQLWAHVRADTVLTPHPKELARLMGQPQSVAEIQRDRFAAVTQLAMSRRCIVVLKGAGTLVGEPDGSVTLIAAGNPGLATGGTGDVLAGIVGGMLAQRMEPSSAAQVAVLLHGRAGDAAAQRVGQAGMCASDVIDGMGEVLHTWNR